MTSQSHHYCLDVRIEKLTPMKIDVIDTVTVGQDPRSDLVISGDKIKNHHLSFIKKGENLALHYLGNTNQTFLNSLPLEEGKIYLLDSGDKIKLFGVEIIIQQTIGPRQVRPANQNPVLNSQALKKPNSIADGPLFKENVKEAKKEKKLPSPLKMKQIEEKMRHEIKQELSLDKGAFISLWLTKFYSLLVDFFVTYFVLVTLLPLVFAESIALKLLNFFSSFVFPSGNHEFFKFLIAWYGISFAQTLVFGTTLGQFMVGLRNKNESTYGKLFLFRLKTFVFSLFLLPAQNSVSDKLFFKGMRKIGLLIIFVAVLLAPLYLPPPYNQFVEVIKVNSSVDRELRTKTITSSSKKLMMSLNAELSSRYMLLPFIKNSGMRAFQLIDLKSNQKIVVYEKEKMLYEDIDQLLEYGNPFYSHFHTNHFKDLPLKSKKQLFINALTITPYNLKTTAPTFGPFFGGAILLKEELLKDFNSSETILQFYAPLTPTFHVSSSEHVFFYLLAPDGVSRFAVESLKRSPLVDIFESQIFNKFLAEPEVVEIRNNQNVEILEAQDSFLHGDEHTLLTYYVGVANSLSNQKIVYDDVDVTNSAKLAVISNVEVVQKFLRDRNVYKSFDDIKYQLTPMENPGVKR